MTSPARATCNAIPGASRTFRSTLGTVDRPFARPGDLVTVRLDPACDGPSPGFSTRADDLVVTLAFAGAAGQRNLVILTTNCRDLARQGDACAAGPAVERAVCAELDRADAPVRLDDTTVRFRFPDTDALVRAADDRLGLAGPVAVAVSDRDLPLPCALATGGCAAVPGLAACVDRLFESDGTCGTTPHTVFASFTALPVANAYHDVCADPAPPCTGRTPAMRFALDADGNVLVPVDWRGVVLDDAAIPVARLVRGSVAVPAFPNGSEPIRVPGRTFLGSFTLDGTRLPPIFDPQVAPEVADATVLFGSADGPETVLRVARRSPTFERCAGGAHDGLPCAADDDCAGGACGPATCVGGGAAGAACASDGDCPGGACGPALFDLGALLADGVGPGTVPVAASALDPVPLDGLARSTGALAFVLAEGLQRRDLNGDGDVADDVLRLARRASGEIAPIGDGAAVGRAVVRVRQPPFSFPAVDAEGDVVAFLEPEPAQGDADVNANGRVFESTLRLFRLDPGGATDLLAGRTLVADAAPVVAGRSLALSDGHLFFRTPEAAAARQATTRVSVGPNGEEGDFPSVAAALSADGRTIAFQSFASRFGGFPGGSQIFLRAPEAGTTELASLAADGTPAHPDATQPALSADAGVVLFSDNLHGVTPDDDNGTLDVFARDRAAGTTVRVSAAPVSPSGLSAQGALSADGRWAAFFSRNTNLVPGDTNGQDDVFVRDLATGTVVRASVRSNGAQGNGPSSLPALSGDGRVVAFVSSASNLVPGDTNLAADVFVHDLLLGATTRVSVRSDGGEANGTSGQPAISADGRVVAFLSAAGNLVPGDTNGATDVFVHDRATGLIERVSLASDGQEGNAPSGNAGCLDCRIGLSADGRVVAFVSEARNLVAGDTNVVADAFVHDRLTGLTTRASVADSGAEGAGGGLVGTFAAALSGDGGTIAFVSVFPNLVPGDGNGVLDVFARGADPADLASDLTGNGRLDDVVLQRVDARDGSLRTLCPAGEVALAAGAALFLRPERSGDASGCPAGPDLNGDGDADDQVVHAVRADGTVENLGRAAVAVALSADLAAALVSEAAEGAADRNGDGDALDTTVAVHPPPGVAGGWTDVGEAADALAVSGHVAAYLVPEAAEGADLNGDGDTADRVLRVYDAAAGTVLPLAEPAEDYVLGESLVAFRTRERAAGNRDLNGDGDVADDVLRVYDLATRTVLESGQAVVPCRLEACDPRLPYRALRDTVTFLTVEAHQGADLNGDGDTADLVLQTFNARATPAGLPAHALVRPGVPTALAAVSVGVCTDTGEACAGAESCPAGRCIVPPGACRRDLGVACDLASPVSCPFGQFCAPLASAPRFGSCQRAEGPCASDRDCDPGAVCEDTGQRVVRVANPLASERGGDKVFLSSGTCDPGGAPCVADADCGGGRCAGVPLTATADDADGDEVPDAFDVCPYVADVAQHDADGDGAGDACDRATCGNGVVEPGEACDGQSAVACPGACERDCRCPCGDPTGDPRARVVVRTVRWPTALAARVRLPLDDYRGEPVAVRLEDDDSAPIAARALGALPPKGGRGDLWEFASREPGLDRVRLKRLPGGRLLARVRARGWFTRADANRPADATRLVLEVGGRCFAEPVTRKVD